MTGVAYNGSTITQSAKNDHVRYTELYNYYADSQFSSPYYHSSALHFSAAKIDGTVNSVSNVYVNGIPIATHSDSTNEHWVANPTPYPHYGGLITTISPSSSGIGNGSVSNGSTTVFVNGKNVAMIGSTVTTHLGNSTTINQGSSNVFVN